MIIFHSLPNIDKVLQNLSLQDKRYSFYGLVDFTLFGIVQRGRLLKIMPKPEFIPTEIAMNDSESAFDYYYWIQMDKDPDTFLAKMDLLKLEYLSGANLIIAVQTEYSPYKSSITESFMGYIRTFYGLETKLITTVEDLIDPDFFKYSGFSIDGLYRLSEDLTRAALMRGETQ